VAVIIREQSQGKEQGLERALVELEAAIGLEERS
jgi:hypothetical protein